LLFNGKIEQAAAAGGRLVEFTDQAFADNLELRFSTTTLVVMNYDLNNRLQEAEPFLARAYSLSMKLARLAPEELPTVVNGLSMLAGSFAKQQRYVEEGRLRKRAVQVVEENLGAHDPQMLQPLVWLGLSASQAVRIAEAEHYWRKAVSVGEAANAQSNPHWSMALSFLATNLKRQGRHSEAEVLARRAVALAENPAVQTTPLPGSLGMLADILEDQGRFAEAEPLRARALEATLSLKLMLKEQFVAFEKVNLAAHCRKQGRFEEAQRWLDEAMLDLRDTAAREGDKALAFPLGELVELQAARGQTQAALQSLERLMQADENPGFHRFARRARLLRKAGDQQRALADLERALALAEEARVGGSGGEHDRAQFFAQFADDFETMIEWRHETRDPAAAFLAAERFRARSMVDQLALQGGDPLAGLPAAEAAQLRANDYQARVKLDALERQLQAAQARKQPSETQQWRAKRDDARQALIEAHREARNASTAYKLAVRADFSAAALSDVIAELSASNELLLSYTLGKRHSYVIAADGNHEPTFEELVVEDSDAQLLQISPGPLTAASCRALIQGGRGQPALAGIARGLDLEGDEPDVASANRLAALWRILVPAGLRDALVTGAYQGLVVVPDGSLSIMPFEMLVVGNDARGAPRYLLDAGPPVRYGPSATVLANLASRNALKGNAAQSALLTVADPSYQNAAAPQAARTITAEFEAAGRFRSANRLFARLPGTRIESDRLARAFREQGLEASQLLAESATERLSRHEMAGKRIVHVACHGLADSAFGNFFGALAMTAGPEAQTDPEDDGFLTLPEIYQLPLGGCELALLSACQTNHGPQSSGEGTWALSRGFLVAGARRVVASNWLVEDLAAAELISNFGQTVAQRAASGQPVRHAAALQMAKRKIRAQPRWAAPYYWAAFVLVGPN
jgi:CHAT domain-containing protein